LTGTLPEVIFILKGVITYFFDNEEWWRNEPGSVAISYESPSASKIATA
jgi:hypothetical protein